MADILISQLPKTNTAGDQDLLIIDSFDSQTGGIVTNAIRWSDLYQKIDSFPQTVMFGDGTSLQPSITFIQDQNTGIYRQADDTIGFSTGGLARMVINQEGNVGVNTLNPTQKFEVANGNLQVTFGISNAIRISPSIGGALIEQVYNLPLGFATNGQERMRVSALGNLLINTDDDVQNVRLNVVGGAIQCENASFTGVSGGVVRIGYNSTGTDKALLHVNYSGAIGTLAQNYGTSGQVLTSQGPGQPWTWGAGGGGSGGGGTGTNPGPAPPADFIEGTLWYDTTLDILFVYDGNDWVPVWDGSTQPGPNEPNNPKNGDLWYNTLEHKLYYYDGSINDWVEVGSGSGAGSVTSIDITEGPGISSTGGPITDAGAITVGLKPLNPDPSGTYTVTNLVVNQYGQITSASSGDAGDLPDLALNDLSDVSAGTPSTNEFLKWNGTAWVPSDVPVPDAVTYKGSIDLLVDSVPVGPSNGDLYINTGVGTISNDDWGADNNGMVLTGGESVYYNADNTHWDIIPTGDSGVVEVIAGDGIAVDASDAAKPVVSLDTTFIDDPDNNIKNVQSDWDETDPTDDSFIQNKPSFGELAEIDDAPNDGKKYTRQSQDWIEETRNSNAGNSSPGDPVIGLLWYDTDAGGEKVLKIYNGGEFVRIDEDTVPVYVSSSAPGSAVEGDLWYDTDVDTLFVRVADTWEPVSGNGVEGSPIEPSDKVVGTLWYDTDNDTLYVWNGTQWDEIVVQDPANPINYVDLTSDQTIDGAKSFLKVIDGTALNCSRKIIVGDGLNGGGDLNQDVSINLDIGDGLAFEGISPDTNLVAKAGDNTIIVDASGIKVDTSYLFNPDNALTVSSWNSRTGDVLPQDDDYSLGQMSDVDLTDQQDGFYLKRVGTKWVAAEVGLPGSLKLMGTIDATSVEAPNANPGEYWVNTGTGSVLNSASWGIIADEAVSDGDLIAALEPIGGQPPQWAIIGNTGAGGGGVNSIIAQNGVTNTGNAGAVVLEADETVVRTSGDQVIAGTKTFSTAIQANVEGNLIGEAQNCGRSVLAGEGLTGGGKLDADVTLDVAHDDTLQVESDLLGVKLGDGLIEGPDGITIDPDSGVIGDGKIEFEVGVNGGITLTGDLEPTANQTDDTKTTITVDNTVVRTIGDQDIEGVKTIANYVVATNGNFDFRSLLELPG